MLYHYTSLATAIEMILPNMRLRMGRYSQTNDPLEIQKWPMIATQSGGGGSNTDAFWRSAHHSWDFAEHVHSRLRVLCLSSDAEDATRPEDRGYALLRMWAQYGEKHTGVCLALAQELLHSAVSRSVKSPSRLWNHSIDYRRLSEPLRTAAYALEVGQDEGELYEHFQRHHEELMFVKAQDWRDEREYRWVYLADRDEDEIYIPIDACLKEVIVGQECHRNYIPAINSACLCGNCQVPIRRVSFDRYGVEEPSVIEDPSYEPTA